MHSSAQLFLPLSLEVGGVGEGENIQKNREYTRVLHIPRYIHIFKRLLITYHITLQYTYATIYSIYMYILLTHVHIHTRSRAHIRTHAQTYKHKPLLICKYIFFCYTNRIMIIIIEKFFSLSCFSPLFFFTVLCQSANERSGRAPGRASKRGILLNESEKNCQLSVVAAPYIFKTHKGLRNFDRVLKSKITKLGLNINIFKSHCINFCKNKNFSSSCLPQLRLFHNHNSPTLLIISSVTSSRPAIFLFFNAFIDPDTYSTCNPI